MSVAHYCKECGGVEYDDKPHNHAPKKQAQVSPSAEDRHKKPFKCNTCKDTGYYGDNGPGIKGNHEYNPCDQCQPPAPPASEKEATSQDTDFTVRIRCALALSNSSEQPDNVPSNPLIQPLLEACDIIDKQAEEIEKDKQRRMKKYSMLGNVNDRLKAITGKQNIWQSLDTIDKQLAYQADEIEKYTQSNVAGMVERAELVEQIKVKDEALGAIMDREKTILKDVVEKAKVVWKDEMLGETYRIAEQALNQKKPRRGPPQIGNDSQHT